MSVSMDEVAKYAGVSKSTVSLVLNQRPGTSEAMRARVLQAAQAVGYRLPAQRPPLDSESLTSAPVIALVHCVSAEPDVDPGLTHLYLSYRNGIQRFTQGRDISVMLVTSYRDDDADSLSYQLLAQPEQALDGLILMGPGLARDSSLLRRALDGQIPTVILGRTWPEVAVSSVSQDHGEQARLVLDHLLALGHERIGFVARQVDRDYDWFRLRLAAYREMVASQTGEANDQYVSIAADIETAVKRLLSEHPEVTAIFALNDHIGYQAMQTALKLGRDVPKSLSITGIDGIHAPDGLPPLTTATFPHEEVGYLAAELLMKQMGNPNLRDARLIVRSHLVAGASCAELV